MKNRKYHFTDVMQRTAALTRWDLDKHSEWGGMVRLSQKYWCLFRNEEAYVGPQSLV